MKKIISLFKRDYEGDRLVYNEVVPGAEWVVEGEGVATQKHDGTACLVRDGKLFQRYTIKKGKTPPHEFEPATEFDPTTQKQEGWVPVGGKGSQWHMEGFAGGKVDGTYELIGPKIQGNPEGCESHVLIRHGMYQLADVPRTFDNLRIYLLTKDIEGVVWHHADGRMVKIKAKDFGLKRGGR